jgi:teichuronic acid biosynthesis glycosyltransferase TuaC
MKRLKVLMLTRLFPSQMLPSFGTFCMERAKALSMSTDVRVMVPTPYFPNWLPGRMEWKRWARVEREGLTPEGIPVSFPRYLSIPGGATWFQGVAMAQAVRQDFKKHFKDWRPDVIDGHFAFPDGYAATQLGKALGVPVMVTCHGSDLRQYPDLPIAGKMTRWTLRTANRVISVSSDLYNSSIEYGTLRNNAVFLQNGVDPEKFQLLDQAQLRAQLNLPLNRKIAIQVAALIDRKDQSLALQALATMRLRGVSPPLLLLIGEGPLKEQLEKEVQRLNLENDVRFLGTRPHAEVALWMGAADWLLLTSKAEGWATVYFEAMSCGRPVITSNVSSAKDAISDPAYGIVVESRTAAAFADAMTAAAMRQYDAQAIRRYAEMHSWSRWAEKAIEVIRSTHALRSTHAPAAPRR